MAIRLTRVQRRCLSLAPLFFTTLVSYRCAVEAAEYGLDTMTPTDRFETGDCDPLDPTSLGDHETYRPVPLSTEFVSVRLIYRDGSQSEILRFGS